ncbi:hypothetical protein LTR37_017815 [Vermiconidia calcicola]|uniref:Uncharacterized protein n=1 Tax=Vermiconidia calcicola TaxID=1690605 RepID=A0ACC3MKB5_9PEZI|nr:hypothetical protein LTR37_017815 [Vermiconidia calcicola]
MRFIRILLTIPTIFATVNATPADDMQSLEASCENAASILNASLNNTMGMNTSSLVQNLTWQVGASKANLPMINSTEASISPDQADDPIRPLDSDYLEYIGSVGTLSEALVRRGRIFHQEMNLPVYDALRGFAMGVQAYGMQLRDAFMISEDAYIRTFTAGSYIVDAQSVWANKANYPGQFRPQQGAYGRPYKVKYRLRAL